MLHRFAKFLAACTVLLILAGSLVTSHDAGLSVVNYEKTFGEIKLDPRMAMHGPVH